METNPHFVSADPAMDVVFFFSHKMAAAAEVHLSAATFKQIPQYIIIKTM